MPSKPISIASEQKADLEIRLLDESHEGYIRGLDNLIMGSIPAGMYHHTDYEMIAQCLASNLSLGLFEGEQLIGYRLTFVPKHGEINLGKHLGMPNEELLKVAQLYGTLLATPFRGIGIGSILMQESLKLVSEKGFRYALVTVHPDNQASLRMCLQCGFEVMKQITFYNELPRLLLKINLK